MTTVQQLVLQYMPLANKLAYQRKRTLPSFIDVEELKSAAYLGLVEAASRYNCDFGVTFSTFAYPRIFGAIHDYLRELGRGVRCVSLNIPDEDCDLENILGVAPERSNDEFLEVAGLDFDDYAKQILRLYFVEEYSMKEVGEKFGVTESRISQLIKRYKQHLRDRWQKCDLYETLAA